MAGVETTSAFAGEPQPVEVFHRGVWYTGELLGWRHDGDGRCLARVRCVVGRLRHSAWKDLADLRLPRPTTSETADAAVAPVATSARPPVGSGGRVPWTMRRGVEQLGSSLGS